MAQSEAVYCKGSVLSVTAIFFVAYFLRSRASVFQQEARTCSLMRHLQLLMEDVMALLVQTGIYQIDLFDQGQIRAKK